MINSGYNMRPSAYYNREDKLYPHMLVDCSQTDAYQAINKLCEFFDTPYINVRFSDKKDSALVLNDQVGIYIMLNTTDLTWLTVCHEFAHHWCWEIDKNLPGHGRMHAKLTKKAVRYIERKHGIQNQRM